jgi:hypothetical protein
MTDYGPGPCETCGEDVEAHTSKQLKKCNAGKKDEWADYSATLESIPAARRKTSPRNGRTIVQALLEEGWKELDTIVEHIMANDQPLAEDFTSLQIADGDFDKAVLQYGEWRGQAQGVAYMLAVLTNPYQPDVDKIRAEAMERWEQGEDDD